ncbi:hypothetical protein DITRI_Ditri17bG0028600 [Diplodiscus trichospermus]
MQNVSGSSSDRARRAGIQNTILGYTLKWDFLDWRANIYSIFVDNLNRRVSKEALWEAFSEFGRVMIVFISFSVISNRDKETTFAFVRYKFRSEMMKAIVDGNNRKIDRWFIRVKEASLG